MTIIGQTQTFLGDGDQHVSADRDPDSLLDCILAGVQKRLDTQIQLDPCEAQLGLPTLSAQTCNQSGFEHEMVDREHDALSGLVLDYGATQRRWIVFAEVKIVWTDKDDVWYKFGPISSVQKLWRKTGALDDEAPKKAFTDALTKAFSHLGLSADVFLGLFDNSKYIEKVKQDLGISNVAKIREVKPNKVGS